MTAERTTTRAPRLLLLVAAVPLAALSAVPFIWMVLRALGSEVDVAATLVDDATIATIVRTVVLALSVAATGIGIAVPLAWVCTFTDVPFRKFLLVSSILPLTIPSYVGAITWLGVTAPDGAIAEVLAALGFEPWPPLSGFVGAWFTLTVFTFPYVLLPVLAVMRTLDGSLERAARSLGAGRLRTLVSVTLPQLAPAAMAGALMSSLYVISDFGVVSLMRYTTLTREVFLYVRSLYDREGAAALALIVSVVAIAIVLIEARTRGRLQRSQRASATTPTVRALRRWRIPVLLIAALPAVAGVVVPLTTLLVWSVSRTPSGTVTWPDIVTAAWHSISASGVAAVVAVVLSLPLAILVARKSQRLSRALDALVQSTLALPGVVIGLAVAAAALRVVPSLYQTVAVLVVGYVIRSAPQAVATMRTSLARIEPRIEMAARSLGASKAAVARRVTLPLALPGIAGGAALVFLTSMKELPATLLLRPSGYDTLATEIWSLATVNRYAAAAYPALVLVAVTMPASWFLLQRGIRSRGNAVVPVDPVAQ